MNEFIIFLRSEARVLRLYALRIVIFGPFLFLIAFILSAWMMLKIKGHDLSIENIVIFFPMLIKVALSGTALILVGMVINQWQEYKRKLNR